MLWWYLLMTLAYVIALFIVGMIFAYRERAAGRRGSEPPSQTEAQSRDKSHVGA